MAWRRRDKNYEKSVPTEILYRCRSVPERSTTVPECSCTVLERSRNVPDCDTTKTRNPEKSWYNRHSKYHVTCDWKFPMVERSSSNFPTDLKAIARLITRNILIDNRDTRIFCRQYFQCHLKLYSNRDSLQWRMGEGFLSNIAILVELY